MDKLRLEGIFFCSNVKVQLCLYSIPMIINLKKQKQNKKTDVAMVAYLLA